MEKLQVISDAKCELYRIFNSLKGKKILILTYTHTSGDIQNYRRAAGRLVDVRMGTEKRACSVSLQPGEGGAWIVDVNEHSEVYLLDE